MVIAPLNAQDASPLRWLEKSTSVASHPLVPWATIQSGADSDNATAMAAEGINSIRGYSPVAHATAWRTRRPKEPERCAQAGAGNLIAFFIASAPVTAALLQTNRLFDPEISWLAFRFFSELPRVIDDALALDGSTMKKKLTSELRVSVAIRCVRSSAGR